MKYYLITYQWKTRTTDWIISMTTWEGSIAEWTQMAIEQEEEYILLNSEEFNKEEYESLKGEL